MDEHVLAADALGHPDRRVAELLHSLRGVDLIERGHALESEAPDVERPEQPREVASAETA